MAEAFEDKVRSLVERIEQGNGDLRIDGIVQEMRGILSQARVEKKESDQEDQVLELTTLIKVHLTALYNRNHQFVVKNLAKLITAVNEFIPKQPHIKRFKDKHVLDEVCDFDPPIQRPQEYPFEITKVSAAHSDVILLSENRPVIRTYGLMVVFQVFEGDERTPSLSGDQLLCARPDEKLAGRKRDFYFGRSDKLRRFMDLQNPSESSKYRCFFTFENAGIDIKQLPQLNVLLGLYATMSELFHPGLVHLLSKACSEMKVETRGEKNANFTLSKLSSNATLQHAFLELVNEFMIRGEGKIIGSVRDGGKRSRK